ncbi:uncharacterized protein [Palaemon carinicauda]|uniref:uncharacterized protein n=1 Tax=Palaemon carinicauda TaxID=392227 RepID=UPI0035B64839
MRVREKMKNGKAVGPDGIPAKAWKALREEGIDLLWDLFEEMYEQEDIPDERRKSFIAPMLHWMCGLTSEDRVRNEYIIDTTGVKEASKKALEARSRWYGHVIRQNDEFVDHRVMEGRPKKSWKDCISEDMQGKECK